MSRTILRPTARVGVVDQHGESHVVHESTNFILVELLDGSTPPPIPGLKEYVMDGGHVNKLDDGSFETPDGRLQLRRV